MSPYNIVCIHLILLIYSHVASATAREDDDLTFESLDDDAEALPTCPPDEEWSDCPEDLCRPLDCAEVEDYFNGPRDEDCSPGCVCVEGMVRGEDGICIFEDECQIEETPSCLQNEELACVHDCPPEPTCRNKGIAFNCLQPTGPCTIKCVCKKGLYRNSIGECITEAQCEQCNKEHEFFSCGPACDNECITREYQNRTNCKIYNIVCNSQCYCDDGYARDCNNTCIPVNECPKIEKCYGKNEVFGCKSICPPSELCLSIVARFRCAEEVANKKTAECTCEPGYYRQQEGGPCIPYCQCKEVRNTMECANAAV